MTTMTTMIPMYPTHYPTTENFRSARALLRCHLAESVAPVVTVAAVVAAAPLVQALAAAVVAELLWILATEPEPDPSLVEKKRS